MVFSEIVSRCDEILENTNDADRAERLAILLLEIRALSNDEASAVLTPLAAKQHG